MRASGAHDPVIATLHKNMPLSGDERGYKKGTLSLTNQDQLLTLVQSGTQYNCINLFLVLERPGGLEASLHQFKGLSNEMSTSFSVNSQQ